MTTETHTLQIGGNTTTITTPEGFGELLNEAMAAEFGYVAASGLSQAEFTAQRVIGFCRDVVAEHMKRKAIEAAALNTEQQTDVMRDQMTVVTQAPSSQPSIF